jgi:hypothetical protein
MQAGATALTPPAICASARFSGVGTTPAMLADMTKTMNVSATSIVEQSRAPFAAIATVLVVLSGCGAPESEDVAPIASETTIPGCHKPSHRNLLKNPGFDANVSGWRAEPGASIGWVAGFDALGCPLSGSAEAFADSTSRVYQCVPIASSTKYNFGLKASRGVYCDVNTFTAAECGGVDNGLRTQAVWINVAWSPDLGSTSTPGDHSLLSFTTTSTDKSARVSCYAYGDANDQEYPFNIDMIYLTPSPGGY